MPRRSQHHQEYTALGKRIRALRKAKNWTQAELAEFAGMSPNYLAEVERGGRNPSIETILNLAAALDVNAGFLVDGYRAGAVGGVEELIELWPTLGEEMQQAIIQVASLFVSGKSASPSRSSSEIKKRE